MKCCEGTLLQRLLFPEFFKAFSDPMRIKIVCILGKSSTPLSVSRIAEELPVDISVVSRHLSVLRQAGILRAYRDGKEVRYSINTRSLIEFLRSLADAFEACCPDEWPEVSGQKGSTETPKAKKEENDHEK